MQPSDVSCLALTPSTTHEVWLVPKLATVRGWRSVPYLYGTLSAVMFVLWHSFAADRPLAWRDRLVTMQPDERALLDGIGKPEAAPQQAAAAHAPPATGAGKTGDDTAQPQVAIEDSHSEAEGSQSPK
eukprot:SAG11_NODE_6697_length_1264_cov_2.075536_1_plen_127_part_10